MAVAAACSGDDSRTDPDPGPTTTTTETPTTAASESADAIVEPTRGECDPVDPTACLLPWPNDRFTRTDEATATGLRVDLRADGTPVNADGIAVDVFELNRNDGFSPA